MIDAAYQGRLTQPPTNYQGRVTDGSTGRMYHGRGTEPSSGKMAEDYKRERKLPPRVEEMLREQVNLDEAVLHDAFAVAMEDLIPEMEANFVAKGLCHLCGVAENHYVPVVNFCPHADENHSLCREHLRSVYRVRMEALFVGRNGSAPNRRLLRCLICTTGCPCTACIAAKEQEVQKYKRYLMDTLRRSGQGSGGALKDDKNAAAASASTAEGRLTYGTPPSAGSIADRRFAQYPPTLPVDGIQRDGYSAQNVEVGTSYDGRRQVQAPLAQYEQYPVDQPSSRDGYHTSMRAQQKTPPQYPPVPKRAAKETAGEMLSVMADSAQAPDPRVVARVASPHVHQGSVESPSAATVLNCAESEKSLVRLLSSLNQEGAIATSMAMDASSQSSKASSQRPSESRNGTSATQVESPSVYSGRGIAGRRRHAGNSYQDQSSTSSVASGDSTPRERAGAGARPATTPRDLGDDTSSRHASQTADHDDNTASEQSDDDKQHNPPKTRPKLSSNPETLEKVNTPRATKKEENQPTQTPTPPPHRGPGRLRKEQTVSIGARAGKKSPQERKTTPSPKDRGRGKRTKRARKDDEETEDEYYNPDDDADVDGEERAGEAGDGDGCDSELDANLDFCEVCQGAGDLVCCDKCPRSFHLKCLHMEESDLPEGDWQCAECKKPSRFDAYSTAVAAEQSLLDKCLKIVECLKSHPFSKPFLHPVENVPLYTRVVKQPMDLSKIENKLKVGGYIVDSNTVAAGVKELDSTHFANDIRLMWSNCKLFNDDGSGITRAADILSAGFERLYKESLQAPLSS